MNGWEDISSSASAPQAVQANPWDSISAPISPLQTQSVTPQGMLMDGTAISADSNQRSLIDKVARQMELAGRFGYEGATGISNLPSLAANGVLAGADYLSGGDIPTRVPYPATYVEKGLDYIGMPKPEGSGENIESGILQGIAGGRTTSPNDAMVPLSAGVGGGVQATAKEGGYSPSVQVGSGLLASMLTGSINPKNFMGNLGDTEAGRLGKILTQNDIPVYASDVLPEGAVKSTLDLTGDLPFSGSIARDEVQQQALNSAIAKQMGMESDVVNPPLMSEADNQSGDVFKYFGNNYNIAKSQTTNLLDDLSIMQSKFNGLDPKSANPLNYHINDILDKVDSNGEIPGTAYLEVRSDLGRLARGTSDPQVEQGAYAIQKKLDSAIAPSIPSDMQDVFNANRGYYRNMLAVEPAVKNNIISGDVSPASLQQGVSKIFPNYIYNDQNALPQITQGAQLLRPSLQASSTSPMQNLVKKYGGGGDAVQLGALMGSPILGPLSKALNPKLSLADFDLSARQQLAKSLMGAGTGAGINEINSYQK